LDEEKSKHAHMAQQTALAHIFAQFAEGCKRQAWQALTPAREEKSVMNIFGLLYVSDWQKMTAI
jgi:hypothetical protein